MPSHTEISAQAISGSFHTVADDQIKKIKRENGALDVLEKHTETPTNTTELVCGENGLEANGPNTMIMRIGTRLNFGC